MSEDQTQKRSPTLRRSNAKHRPRNAVALAGGFTYRAITDKVVLTRVVGGSPQEYGAGPGDLLLPGDSIEVRQRMF